MGQVRSFSNIKQVVLLGSVGNLSINVTRGVGCSQGNGLKHTSLDGKCRVGMGRRDKSSTATTSCDAQRWLHGRAKRCHGGATCPLPSWSPGQCPYWEGRAGNQWTGRNVSHSMLWWAGAKAGFWQQQWGWEQKGYEDRLCLLQPLFFFFLLVHRCCKALKSFLSALWKPVLQPIAGICWNRYTSNICVFARSVQVQIFCFISEDHCGWWPISQDADEHFIPK